MGYSGSNAMYRACHSRGQEWTWADAVENGRLVKGALVFILERDGKEPAKYQSDGLGNASHVGIVVLQSDNVYTVDASSNNYLKTGGTIHAYTKSRCPEVWTHVGWIEEIDYSADGVSSTVDKPSTVASTPPKVTDIYQPDDFEPMDEDSDGTAWNPADTELEDDVPTTPTVSNKPVTSTEFPYEVIVTTAQGALNLRKTPSTKGELRGKAEKGATLLVYAEESHEGITWGQTYTTGFDGTRLKCWFNMEFVTKKAAPPPVAPEPAPAPVEPAAPAGASLDDKINALDKLLDMVKDL
jgi:hypothetical protein